MNAILKFIRWVIALFFASTILAVVAYRFIPVYVTPLMIIRCVQTGHLTMHHHWVALGDMSKHMPVAVMASEDQRFLLHHGFDYDAIEKAAIHNRRTKGTKHGASTISQQTAKNVFLWPGRSWVRKGFEVYFTALVELLWSKQRIMEVYLNSIEMGEGIYGLDACAEQHFDKRAGDLSRAECALIAATLPNPRKLSSKNPSAYVRMRQKQIQREMKFIPAFPKEGEDINPRTVVGGAYAR
ncbi:MAG: monofunctional biosynthetic peptidoglycan transglycosylase [Prevotella sp.]|nr:monofunctional biosynthetic peptidoglycan transglycosylase [Prevotella sp.]